MSGDAEINSSLSVGEARDRADVSGVRVDRARDVYVTAGEGRSALWVNVPGLRGRRVIIGVCVEKAMQLHLGSQEELHCDISISRKRQPDA